MNFLKKSFFRGSSSSSKSLSDQSPDTNNDEEKNNSEPVAQEEQPSHPEDLQITPSPNSSEKSDGNSERSSLWKLFSSKLGMDVSVGVSLPVWLFEPTTLLTRMCEMVHFHSLLIEAAKMESPLDRLAYVAVFTITGYNGTERYGKPFNSVLGETYEYIDEHTKTRFLAEQVSHHPPISASHCENEYFKFWQESRIKTRFNGNSVDLDTQGKTHIYFPHTQDHFVYTCPTSTIHNIILGRLWIDHSGDMSITNTRTGDTCVLHFERCGWLNRGRHEVSGYVKDSQGRECIQIFGKWSSEINVKWVRDDIEGCNRPKGTTVCAWKRPSNNSIGKHKLTEFAIKLNEMDEAYQAILPPTDSRLRYDRLALEQDDLGEAATAKGIIEDRQRQDKKARQAEGREWSPRWFKQTSPSEGGSEREESMWVYSGDYWEQREKKVQLLSTSAAGANNNNNTNATKPEEDYLAQGIRGLVCDFTSYDF